MNGLRDTRLSESIEEMITTYQDVNSSIDSYVKDPGVEIYARHIGRNRPFVVRGGCSKWASRAWSVDYLNSRMEGKSVKVAETPLGNADAVIIRPEDRMRYFVKPHERYENFLQLVSFLQADETLSPVNRQSVKYSQARTYNSDL